MNVIGIAWNVVDDEVNLMFWYKHNKDESHFLGNLLLLVIWSFGRPSLNERP
jgi:hypothetical protein